MNNEYLLCIIYNLNICKFNHYQVNDYLILVLKLFLNLKTKNVKHEENFGITI
jgi:hypothetical protein